MTQGSKDGIKALTAKIRDNPDANADIIANCDEIDAKIDAEPTE